MRIIIMKISDHVMLLGNDQFRFYVVGGDNAALIECGTRAGASIFARQWQALPNKPHIRYLIALHSHFDHICGVTVLKELFPEARLIASEPAVELMLKEKIVKKHFAHDEQLTRIYLDKEYLTEAPAVPAVDQIFIDRAVQDGEMLELEPGLTLKFIYTPGHSSCSMAAYLEPDQVMFTSDAASSQYLDDGMIPSFYTGYNDFVNSIKELSAIPSQAVCPGHGKIALGEQQVQRFYQLSLDACQEMFTYVKEQLQCADYDEEVLIGNMIKKYIRDVFSLFPDGLSVDGMQVRIRRIKEAL